MVSIKNKNKQLFIQFYIIIFNNSFFFFYKENVSMNTRLYMYVYKKKFVDVKNML